MAVMDKSERLKAAIRGEPVDRVPVALWRHFPVDDTDAETLAESAVSYQREFDLDLVKVTPSSSFSVRDWGVEDAWKGDPEGTKDYIRRVVVEPRAWAKLEPRDPTQGELGAQLRCLEIARRLAAPDVPVLPTVFSPLAQAKHLAGEDLLLEHLHRSPAEVEVGLRTITRSTIAWVEEARKRGIAGVFYAVQHATYGILDREAYRRFGEAYDRQILEAAGGFWLNVLHLHGEALMFDLAETYPVQVVNWHDRHTEPGLVEGKRRVVGAVCGGLRRWETLALGTPQAVEAEAREAIGALAGRGMILGAGCVVPVVAPRANLRAARRAPECA